MNSTSIDKWRQYFRIPCGDIFDVIDNAITVAYTDFPEDFTSRRDRIVEKLYTCQLNLCSGCDRVQVVAPKIKYECDAAKMSGGVGKSECDVATMDRGVGKSECNVGKASMVNSSVDENCDVDLKCSSNYSYREAEAPTEEIEEESRTVGEVLRIKELLSQCEDQSEDEVVESLRRLQLMSLSMETLQATKIGVTVSPLRKHKSKRISNFARSLVREWKDIVKQWINVMPTIKGEEGSPESVNPSVVEEGLPSPPLDEGAFIATQTTSIELSRVFVLNNFFSRIHTLVKGLMSSLMFLHWTFVKFFEGMDDDGNIKNSEDFNVNHGNARKPAIQNQRITLRIHPPNEENTGSKENKGQDMRKKDSMDKQTKLSNTDVPHAWPPKPISRHKGNDLMKLRQELDAVGSQKIPLPGQHDRSKCLTEEAVQMKLQVAKHKLQNGYQQAENAKKQRIIQVMDSHELPNQGARAGNPRVRPGSHNYNFSSGLR